MSYCVILRVQNTKCWIENVNQQVLDYIDGATSYVKDEALRVTTPRWNIVDQEDEVWDGYHRFLKHPQGYWPYVPSGLRYIVETCLQNLNVPYQVLDERIRPQSVPSDINPIPLFDYQEDAAKVLEHEPDGVARMSPRCFAHGTSMVLSNGSIEPVEALRSGDRLIGPDGFIRTIQEVHQGFGPLYRVVPSWGDSFVTNGSHLLAVARRRSIGTPPHRSWRWVEEIIETSSFLDLSETAQRRTQLYRKPIEYQDSDPKLPIPSYGLGLILGDGSIIRGCPDITSDQPEVVEGVKALASSMGVSVFAQSYPGKTTTWRLSDPSKRNNPLIDALRLLGLWGCSSRTKFIPEPYLVSSIDERLELLAGILDCDGHASNKYYDWVTASQRLAQDVRRLCFSVGLCFSMRPKKVKGYDHTYWRCSIMGPVDRIPLRVKRKVFSSGNQWRDTSRTRFKVEFLGEGHFHGFTLDGDHRFLMPDGTVQHNSGKTRTLVETVRRLGLPTLWVAPTRGILTQTVKSAGEFLGSQAVHVTTKNWMDHRDTLLTVTTAGSMLKLPREFWMTRAHLVADEIHHYLANKAWGGQMMAMSEHIFHRKGMTGTFFRSCGDDLALLAYLSRVLYTIDSAELLSRGRLVPTHMAWVPINGPQVRGAKNEFWAPKGHGTLGLSKHQFRLDVVASVAKHLQNKNRTVLILVGTKEQGNAIAKRLSAMYPSTPSMCEFEHVEFVSTDRTKKVVERVLTSFRERQEVRILIGTSMIGEGIDLPSADALVYAAGGKAAVGYVQALYRVCTATPGKEYAVCVDFIDRHHKKLLEHSRQRNITIQGDPVFQQQVLSSLDEFVTWSENAWVA